MSALPDLRGKVSVVTGGGATVLCPGVVRTTIHASSRNRPERLAGGAPVQLAPQLTAGP